MRLSRSEDSLADIQLESPILATPVHQPQVPSSRKLSYREPTHYSSDDEDYFFANDHHLTKDCDSMSSSNSITTEANCDFEFYQTKESPNNNLNKISNGLYHSHSDFVNIDKPKHISNTKITRSSSKRSLENFQAFIEETTTCIPNDLEMKNKGGENISRVVILHRSNSYTTLEDKKRRRRCKKGVSRSNSKASEFVNIEDEMNMRNKKIKSVEYLPNSVYIEDLKNNNDDLRFVGSSVPDFKKVFISEYI